VLGDDPAAFPVLRFLLDDKSAAVRLAVLVALSERADPAAAVIPPIIQLLVDEDVEEIREVACRTIVSHRSEGRQVLAGMVNQSKTTCEIAPSLEKQGEILKLLIQKVDNENEHVRKTQE